MVAGTGAGLFPLPTIQEPWPSQSRSRKVQQRRKRALAATHLANRAIHTLNSLHSPVFQNRNASPPTASVRAAAHVYSCCVRHVSRQAPFFANGSSGDGSSQSNIEISPFDTASAPTYNYDTLVLPLSADAVSLPTSRRFVDLLQMLPPAIALEYAEPNPQLFRSEAERPPARKAFLVRSRTDYSRIIKRMHELTMVRFVRKPKAINGVFAAPKSEGRQRLVMDGRPANAVFAASPKVDLPTPDLLAGLFVDASRDFFVAKVDLDNFYHRIKVPAWMTPYFALPAVRAEDVGQQHVFGVGARIYPC